MAETTKKRDIRSLFIDPEMIRRVVAETYARMGIEPDPTATAEKAQEMMLAQGVRPEDNLFSRGIIEARYGKAEEKMTPEQLYYTGTAYLLYNDEPETSPKRHGPTHATRAGKTLCGREIRKSASLSRRSGVWVDCHSDYAIDCKLCLKDIARRMKQVEESGAKARAGAVGTTRGTAGRGTRQ